MKDSERDDGCEHSEEREGPGAASCGVTGERGVGEGTIRASQSQSRGRSSAVTASPASMHHHSHSIVAVAIAASRALPCRTCFFAARCNLTRSFLSSFFCFLAAFACEVHGERTGQEQQPQARPTKLRVTSARANVAAADRESSITPELTYGSRHRSASVLTKVARSR